MSRSLSTLQSLFRAAGHLLALLPSFVGDPHCPVEVVADAGETIPPRRLGVFEEDVTQRQQLAMAGAWPAQDLRRMRPVGVVDQLAESLFKL